MNRTAQQVADAEAVSRDAAIVATAYAAAYTKLLDAASNPSQWTKLWTAATDLYHTAPVWGKYVLITKEVPQASRKDLEKALAEFKVSSRKLPYGDQITQWVTKKLPHAKVLYDAATVWPDRKVADSPAVGAQTFRHGPFTVNNLVGKDPTAVLAAIDDVVQAIKGSGIRGFDRVLYGDINVVGKLARPEVLAFYDINLDQVFVKIMEGTRGRAKEIATRAMDPVTFRHTIIHELAHRFWRRFLTDAQRKAWAARHFEVDKSERDLTRAFHKTPIPLASGDLVPGLDYKGMPLHFDRVSQYDEKVHLFMFQNDRKVQASIPLPQFLNHLKKFGLISAPESAFPTWYSKTDAEEHFCDAVGLLAQKRLQGGHEEPLRKVLAELLA